MTSPATNRAHTARDTVSPEELLTASHRFSIEAQPVDSGGARAVFTGDAGE
jgi:hypothetical protein